MSVTSIMHLRSRSWLALVLAIVVALGVVRGATAQDEESGHGWVSLGPPGRQPLTSLAVAPDWSSDRFILATRSRSTMRSGLVEVVRSADGGTTWETFPAPADSISGLSIASPGMLGRPAFAWTSEALFRSSDAGASWARVLDYAKAPRAPLLALSPDIATDGVGFLLAGGRLYRTADGGVTWEGLDPGDGQRVQDVAISPSFASDLTVFVAAATVDYEPRAFSSKWFTGEEPVAYEQSIGVLKSNDGGATWQPSSVGIDVGGTPYRRVDRLVISPTYGSDQTVFAFALGPFEETLLGAMRVHGLHAALFRSSDAGATWTSVYEPAWRPTGSGSTIIPLYRLRPVLSPRFADDGIALLAEIVSWPGGAGGGCSILRTDDSGATWDRLEVLPALTSSGNVAGGCLDLDIAAGEAGSTVAFTKLTRRGSAGPTIPIRSLDGGRTWEELHHPPAVGWDPGPARLAGDGTILLGGVMDGIWVLGPSARPAGSGP